MYPELSHEELHALPYIAREIIQVGRKIEMYASEKVLTLDQVKTYRELLEDRQNLSKAAEDIYGSSIKSDNKVTS